MHKVFYPPLRASPFVQLLKEIGYFRIMLQTPILNNRHDYLSRQDIIICPEPVEVEPRHLKIFFW